MSEPKPRPKTTTKQDYQTPRVFRDAVEKRFGEITFDLAAHSQNKVHWNYFTAPEFKDDRDAWAVDSFKQDWHPHVGLLWLNPPFADIAPWAQKCAAEAVLGANVVMLVPASLGSNWFRDFVAPCADTYLLNGRMTFDGKNPFPKDLALFHFHPNASGRVLLWDWRKDIIHQQWCNEARFA